MSFQRHLDDIRAGRVGGKPTCVVDERLLYEQLDLAVLAAYAATDPQGKWSEDWAQVWTDTGAGQPLPADHDLAELRKETDQRVLANLLRMNLDRAGMRETSAR